MSALGVAAVVSKVVGVSAAIATAAAHSSPPPSCADAPEVMTVAANAPTVNIEQKEFRINIWGFLLKKLNEQRNFEQIQQHRSANSRMKHNPNLMKRQ